MNKKGGEKWLSVWWFFVLVVIGGAIVIGVLIYYSQDVNVKGFEADILTGRIIRCLVDNGYLREAILEEDFDIYSECGLKREIFEKTANFYFAVSVKDEGDGILREGIVKGDINVKKNCEIVGRGMEARHFSRCVHKSENVLYYENCKVKRATLDVFAGSDQDIKKVSII